MSKFLAYTFLYDDSADLKCDFEILTDEISSMIGFLRSLLSDADKTANPDLEEDLCKINELMYHINPSLRTKVSVTAKELAWLEKKTMYLETSTYDVRRKNRGISFFIPQGCTQAAYSHIIRNKCKAAVRMLSRHKQQENTVDEILFEFLNLFSGYFFFLALWFNKNNEVEESPFISRVY